MATIRLRDGRSRSAGLEDLDRASALWTGLHALDGVDLLYAGSQRVAQDGHALDLRLGAVKAWRGSAATVSSKRFVLHNDFAGDAYGHLRRQYWDPGLQIFRQRARIEHNVDQTRNLGTALQVHGSSDVGRLAIGWIGR